jgi:type IV secretory pathway TrbL component
MVDYEYYERILTKHKDIDEKKKAKPRWSEHSTGGGISFSRENFKNNLGTVKKYGSKVGHGVQKGANYLAKTFPGLADTRNMERAFGGGYQPARSHQSHHQHHNSNSQHIYIHHVTGGGKKRKNTRSNNPFDMGNLW